MSGNNGVGELIPLLINRLEAQARANARMARENEKLKKQLKLAVRTKGYEKFHAN